MANENQPYEKWYQKTWLIFLALILVWPIGLVLTWMSNWRPATKVILTVTVVLLVGYTYLRTGSLFVFI